MPNDENSQIAYYIEDIEGMKNNYKLPIFFLDACLTGKLDNNIFDRGILILYPYCLLKILLENIFDTKHFPCFAWTILKKPSGGGIGVTRMISALKSCLRLKFRLLPAGRPNTESKVSPPKMSLKPVRHSPC